MKDSSEIGVEDSGVAYMVSIDSVMERFILNLSFNKRLLFTVKAARVFSKAVGTIRLAGLAELRCQGTVRGLQFFSQFFLKQVRACRILTSKLLHLGQLVSNIGNCLVVADKDSINIFLNIIFYA